jgi:uridine phosphorylase
VRHLRIGTLGVIVAGVESGRVVEVIDDAANTGGYLIFTYADLNRSPEVFDSWVESIVDVDLFFDEAGWQVDWMDPIDE